MTGLTPASTPPPATDDLATHSGSAPIGPPWSGPVPLRPVEASGTVELALGALRAGGFVVMGGDEAGGGYLVLAAQATTVAGMAFMIRHTSGVICVGLEGERLDALRLPPMVTDRRWRATVGSPATGASTGAGATAPADGGPGHLAFTVSVDVVAGTVTGTSAADRCQTVHTLLDPGTRPDDLRRPGHVFPVRYEPGGVLRRAGHAEAAVDLARLAGLHPAAVLAEIVSDDGTTPHRRDLEQFAARHGMPVVTIADVVRYRRRRESLVRRVSSARLPTRHGELTAVVFESVLDGTEHVALVRGDVDVAGRAAPLAHVHLECPVGDTLGSLLCPCGGRLDDSLARISGADAGVLVYLRRGGDRSTDPTGGLPLCPHADRARADGRSSPASSSPYDLGAQILTDLGVRRLQLLTEDPDARGAIHAHGLEILHHLSPTAEIAQA